MDYKAHLQNQLNLPYVAEILQGVYIQYSHLFSSAPTLLSPVLGNTAAYPPILSWTLSSFGTACTPSTTPHIYVLLDAGNSTPVSVFATLDIDVISLSVALDDMRLLFLSFFNNYYSQNITVGW